MEISTENGLFCCCCQKTIQRVSIQLGLFAKDQENVKYFFPKFQHSTTYRFQNTSFQSL